MRSNAQSKFIIKLDCIFLTWSYLISLLVKVQYLEITETSYLKCISSENKMSNLNLNFIIYQVLTHNVLYFTHYEHTTHSDNIILKRRKQWMTHWRWTQLQLPNWTGFVLFSLFWLLFVYFLFQPIKYTSKEYLHIFFIF